MRRELPFQEVVPLDGAIAVVNAGKWYNKNLKVTLFAEGSEAESKSYDEDGVCLFGGLTNDVRYRLEIRRRDLKGRFLYRKQEENITPKNGGVSYVILVGASVGKSWRFNDLSKRGGLSGDVVLGTRTKYAFDKTEEIDDISNLPMTARGVIIKECAAYFPRDLEVSRRDIEVWVSKLRAKGITPIIATVVPVTEDHDRTHPKRFDSILEYNDYIKQYAIREKIRILDLEKAVRNSEENRHLSEECAQPDGLHLQEKGYERLDAAGMALINALR